MFTEFMYIALAVCLLLGACSEVGLAYGMSFGALLEKSFLIIAIIWISLAVRKSQARAKVRAKLPPVVLPRRSRDFPAMS